MGLQQSLPDESIESIDSPSSILWQLSECSAHKLSVAFGNLKARHLTTDKYVESTTLAFGLPFSVSIATQVTRIFADKQGRADWKECFEALVFLVAGSPDVKLRLMFDINAWSLREVFTRDQTRAFIIRLLFNTDRLVKADSKLQADGSVDTHSNIAIVANDLVAELQDLAGSNLITFSVFEQWLQECVIGGAESDMCNKVLYKNNLQLGSSNTTPGSPRVTTRGQYHWSQVPCDTSETVPPSRSKHAVAVYNGCMYMYGGRDGNIGLKDLWKFIFVTNRWQQLLCHGERPPLLQEHTMAAHKGKLYVFGGAFSASHETPLWILSLDMLTWLKHKVDGEVTVPCGRRGHTSVVHDHAMHIYGGYMDLKGSTSELWTFDFGGRLFLDEDIEDQCMWHLAYSSSMTDDGPGARHGHTAIVHDDSMWVFGGMCDLQPRNDLWKWNFGLRKWHRVKCKNGPHGLVGHSASKVPDGMLIYGGENAGSLQGDLWKFTFACQTWQRISVMEGAPSARTQHRTIMIPAFLLDQAWSGSTNERSRSVPLLQAQKNPDLQGSVSRPFSSPPAVSNEQASHNFRNKIQPADSTTELLIGPFQADLAEQPIRGSGYENIVLQDETSLSSGTRVKEMLNKLTSPSDSVQVLSIEACKSLSNQAEYKDNRFIEHRESNIPDRAIELRENLRQMRKSKTFEAGSMSRLLSSASESSEDGLDNPSFALDMMNHVLRFITEKEEHTPVKKHRKHFSGDDNCVSMEMMSMKSASTESILSISHNSQLPPPYWMHANKSSHSPKSVIQNTLKCNSWDSLLKNLGGVQLTCVDINPDECVTTSQFAGDLVLEDLEDTDLDKLYQNSQSISTEMTTCSPVSQSRARTKSEASLCIHPCVPHDQSASGPKSKLPDLLLDLSESTTSLNKIPVKNNWLPSPTKELGDTLKPDSQTPGVNPSNARFTIQDELMLSIRGNNIVSQTLGSHEPGRSTQYIDETELEPFTSRRKRGAVLRYAPSTQPLKKYLRRRCVPRPDTIHIFVLGGKDSESCNIGRKPLPLWCLDVLTGPVLEKK